MNMQSTEQNGHDADPELVAALTELFNERANRFDGRPMSFERLEAAAIVRSGHGRVRYPLAVAAVVLVVGLVIGLTVWGGSDEAINDPLQAVVVDEDGDTGDDAETVTDGQVDPEGDRSDFGQLSPTTNDADDESESSAAGPTTSQQATPDPDDAETTEVTEPSPDTSLDDGTTTGETTLTTEPEQTTTTTGETTTTEQPATTAGPGSQQLASPNLGALVPHFTDSVADPGGQVELRVAWAAVPGATGYENVYSLDGREIVRPGTAGTAATPVAITWYQGAPGRQYCLQVIAVSQTQPASEPSVVCSVNASPMRPSVSVTGEDVRATWTAVESAAQYEVLTSVNGQAFEFVTQTSQSSVTIDRRGRTGQFCVILRALNGGGSRIQSAAKCIQA